MTPAPDLDRSQAAQLNEIASIVAQARDGNLPPANAVAAIGRILSVTVRSEVYQKPWG